MAGLVPAFQPQPEGSIASYNAMDAATGVGYKNYYCLYATSSKSLCVTALDSATPYTAADSSYGSATKVIDLDFDITFKMPQVIEGDLLINYTIGQKSAGSGTTASVYGIVKARHVDAGATETDLTTAQSATYTTNTGGQAERVAEVLAITKRHFSIGEKLRITIEIWGSRSGSDATTALLWHNPSNEKTASYAGTVYPSRLYTDYTTRDTDITVSVPFRIDL